MGVQQTTHRRPKTTAEAPSRRLTTYLTGVDVHIDVVVVVVDSDASSSAAGDGRWGCAGGDGGGGIDGEGEGDPLFGSGASMLAVVP